MNKIVDLERLGVFKGKLDEIIISGSVYDVVIRTQEQFDELIASEDWLGASSVCFVGDGGDLIFASPTDFIIPNSVYTIKGICAATIGNTLKYSARVTEQYSIDGITIKGSDGFRNCYNLTNCNSILNNSSTAYGFTYCTNISQCKAHVIGGTGSRSCVDSDTISNCNFYTEVNEGVCYGVIRCSNVANCQVAVYIPNATGVGLYDCTNVSSVGVKIQGDSFGVTGIMNGVNIVNVTITIIGSGDSSCIRNSSWISNCQAGADNTATFLIGANLYVDDITVAGKMGE